ncbi:MAG: MarR family transcriptional regulator [Woeseiaceae bacterium]|nr:MarR family transcriptional regulator [Woeseiaceae bacterium]
MNEPKLSRLQASSWIAVVETYQECNRRYAAMLREFDLTVPQFDVLNAIHSLGDNALPKRIAERMLVTRGNVSGVLNRLQEHRLIVTRQTLNDRRSFVCELTPAGAKRLDAAKTAAALFIEEQLSPFDEDEMQSIERKMRAMKTHLETLDPVAIALRAKTQEELVA